MPILNHLQMEQLAQIIAHIFIDVDNHKSVFYSSVQ